MPPPPCSTAGPLHHSATSNQSSIELRVGLLRDKPQQHQQTALMTLGCITCFNLNFKKAYSKTETSLFLLQRKQFRG